jgi:hypothetical protein
LCSIRRLLAGDLVDLPAVLEMTGAKAVVGGRAAFLACLERRRAAQGEEHHHTALLSRRRRLFIAHNI